MADEFNNQGQSTPASEPVIGDPFAGYNPNANAGYAPNNTATAATGMNANLKGTLISGGVFLFGIVVCSLMAEAGAVIMLAGFIAMIVFVIRYIQDVANEPNTGCIPIGTHVALTLLTSGIWAIYWYYRTTKYLKQTIPGYTKEPSTETLLCALVPYYQIYWAYKTGEAIEGIAASKGIQKDVKIVALIIGIFTYWFGPVIYLQAMMNEIIGSPVMGAPIPQNQPNVNYQAAPQPNYQAAGAQPNYQAVPPQPNYQAAPQPGSPEGYYSMGEHVLLTLLTCGIWSIIWYHRTTKYMRNHVPGYTKDPGTETLLCALVPYYHLYWEYKMGETLEGMFAAKGIQKDIKIVALIIGLFTYWWGPTIYIQMMLNEYITSPIMGAPIPQNQPVAPSYPAPQAYAPQPVVPSYPAPQPAAPAYPAPQATVVIDPADELKKYKDLLDSGIITQEEYDVKKKELLGL